MPGEGPAMEAVLFDLDNTLLDRDRGFLRFCQELYRSNSVMGFTHTEEEAVALMASFDANARRPREAMLSDFIRQWPGVFRDLGQAMHVYHTSYPKMLFLEPSTRKLLEDLKKQNIPSAIVTNGNDALQTSKVRESGLNLLVQSVVISEDVGVAKPDRRIFEQALARIDARPSTTLFVGDTPDADILGAKSLGITTAWVHRGRQWPFHDQRPDYIVGHVSEARQIVLG